MKYLLILVMILPIIIFAQEERTLRYQDEKALEYFENKQYTFAIEEYSKLIRTDNSVWEYHYMRGYCYLITKAFAFATANLTEAINLGISKEEFLNKAYVFRALSLMNLEKYDRALEDCLYIINKNVKNIDILSTVYQVKGCCYFYKKRYSLCINNLEKCLSFGRQYLLNEDLIIIYTLKASALYELENYYKAISDYRQLIKLNPDDLSSVYIEMAKCWIKLEKYISAIKNYTKAIELNPNHAEFYVKRGLLYFKTKDYQNALVDLQIGYNRVSTYGYKENIGLVCFGLQRYDEAIEICEETLFKKSDLNWSMLILAMSYEKKGNIQKAIKYYNKYLSRDSAEKFNKEYFNIDIRQKLINLQSNTNEQIVIQSGQKIAVLTLDAVNLSKNECIVLTDRLRYEIIAWNTNITVIERRKIQEVLQEQRLQLSGLTTTKDLVQVGKLLNVQKIVTGSIGKIGSFYSIQLKIINVETCEITAMVVEDVEGSMRTVIKSGLKNIVEKLSKSLVQ